MIREAKSEDLDGLIELYRALMDYHKDFGPMHKVEPYHYEVKRKIYKAIIEESTPAKNLGFILVDEEDAKLVGMIVSQYVSSLDGHRYKRQVFVQDLYVDPSCRRKHIGINLGHEAFTRCIKDGIELAYIWVAPENTHVQKVVEGMGFKTAFKFDTVLLSDYKKHKILQKQNN